MRFLVYIVFALVAVEAHRHHKHKRVFIDDGSPPPPPPPDFGKFLQHFLRIDAPFVSVRTAGQGYHKSVSVDAPFVSVRTSGGVPSELHTKTYHKTVSVDAPFVSVRTGQTPTPSKPHISNNAPQPSTSVNVDAPFVSVKTSDSPPKRNSVESPVQKSVSVDAPFVSVRTSGEVPNVKVEETPQKEIVKPVQEEEKNVHVQAPFVTVNSHKGGTKVEAPFTTVNNGHVNVDLSPIFGSGFNLVDVMAPFTNVKVSGLSDGAVFQWSHCAKQVYEGFSALKS